MPFVRLSFSGANRACVSTNFHNNHHDMGKIAAKYPYLVLLFETLDALLRNQNKMLLSDATRVPIHFIQRLNRLNDEGLHENQLTELTHTNEKKTTNWKTSTTSDDNNECKYLLHIEYRIFSNILT